MLKALAYRGDPAMTERLRRGLDPATHIAGGEEMARVACFSRRQFHRLALQFTGETPVAHRRRLRLDCAALRLLNSRTPVLAIALDARFESHETFTRAFRRRFALTPSAFRRQRGMMQPAALQLGFSLASLLTHGIQTS